MPKGANGKDDSNLPVYESEPPDWLPKAHTSADLGYPGFYPPYPGQDEDILSQANIKNGFNVGLSVPAETFSAQDVVRTRFVFENAVKELEDLMNEVFARRADHIPAVPPSTFRMPSRVTLNDAKRLAWFADLANPDVPLYKLGKSVPHGAKGHDLLDLLHSNDVAIPRAVWFLRVFGANETAGLRNKPSYNPTQYSVDWAIVVTSYMKKQLAEITLPSAPRPGLNIKSTFKGVLADVESRDRWISRFTYCLELLRVFYAEGLVDNKTFLTWLVQQMLTCNLAQAGFVTRLADEYLDEVLRSRALSKLFIDACLGKLVEIRAAQAQDYLNHLEALLKVLLQRASLALPDAFISPRTWTAHSNLLEEVLVERLSDFSSDTHPEQSFNTIEKTLSDNLTDIKRRNEAMLFRNLPPRVLGSLGSAVSDIQLLNSISSDTDLTTFPFFNADPDNQSFTLFSSRLNLLLTWSVTPVQYGDHRPYAAVTLLRIWRDRAEDRATRRDTPSPDEFVQDQLFDWLDASDAAADDANLTSVSSLFGKFVKQGLFSYASYIQRLIARGEPGIFYSENEGSRHRNFLRCIPLHQSTSSLIIQRRVTLYGARSRETPEDCNEREIRKEIRAVLPELFQGDYIPTFVSTNDLLASCPALLSASRYEQVRIFKQWLLPNFRKHVISQTQEKVSHTYLAKSYGILVELMVHTKCYGSMLDLDLFMLEHATTNELMTPVIENLHLYAIMWTSMDVAASITSTLYSTYQSWRSKGMQSRILLAFLLEVENGRYLDATARDHVHNDITAFTHALYPETDHPDPVPPVLPEILLLAEDPNPEGPSVLANSLWYKYRTAFDWAWKVWDNTVASLRQVPVMTSDTSSRRACALRYAGFLLHVDQHLPGGFDGQVLEWFLGPGKNEVAALSADAWDVLTVVVLYLSVHGALTTVTILKGLVYPAWQLGISASTTQQGEILQVFLHAANNLFEHLLLRDDGNVDGMPPADILEVQRIRARRREVYNEPHFSVLVANIPTLVLIEKNSSIPEDLRLASAAIRCNISKRGDFLQGAYRNLESVRLAFEQPLSSDTVKSDLCEPLIDALRLILSDCTSSDVSFGNWGDISSLLSPWKLAATAIQLQYMLKQIGQALTQESTRAGANECLDKVIFPIFRHTMTSDEAYFVAEMARGFDSSVAGKFINDGLQCLGEIMIELATPFQAAELAKSIERMGELLRVLVHVAEPLREDINLLPRLNSDIQDTFISALTSKFESVESMLVSTSGESSPQIDDSATAETVIFLARLLQFDLAFRGAWTKATKELSGKLTMTLFRIALAFSTSQRLDPLMFRLLIDTLYFLIDEIPSDPKAAAFDPFRHYPDVPSSDIPLDTPPEYCDQLRSLLPALWTNPRVVHLVNAHRDSNGALVHGSPVLNRPWEWVENLGDHPVQDIKDEEKEREEKARHLVKNSASLSLDLFAARMTGDRIFHSVDDPRTNGNILSFEDGLSSETLFRRDWRETRIELDEEAVASGTRPRGEEEDELKKLPSFPGAGRRSSSRRGSPASSVRTRTSVQAPGSATSYRASPGQSILNRNSNSTISEPLDVDNDSTAGSSTLKRKATTVSDDEVEIIEGPVPGAVKTTKKIKTTKPKARKK